MHKIIIILLMLESFVANCQLKKVSLNTITNKYVSDLLIKNDSIITVLKYPQIEMWYFKVNFSEAFYDKRNGKFRLIGKICIQDAQSCEGGLPGIGIFKGYRDSNNFLHNVEEIGETLTSDTLIKLGTFDITFSLKKRESLFFYYDHNFYLEEYKLGELVNNKPVSILNNQAKKHLNLLQSSRE